MHSCPASWVCYDYRRAHNNCSFIIVAYNCKAIQYWCTWPFNSHSDLVFFMVLVDLNRPFLTLSNAIWKQLFKTHKPENVKTKANLFCVIFFLFILSFFVIPTLFVLLKFLLLQQFLHPVETKVPEIREISIRSV